MQQAWGATGKRMLEVEPLKIGPCWELLEQPVVIWSWVVVQEPVLLLGGELQIETRCGEPAGGTEGRTQGSHNCP